MANSSPLRIAVLINGLVEHHDEVVNCFRTAIAAAHPRALFAMDFYDPIGAREYPDPAIYELLVLSGGSVDPNASEPWVLDMRNFLKTTRRDHPMKKIVGICWGHQIVAVTFEGKVGPMTKAEIGVTTIPLTSPGATFFNTLPQSQSYDITEYHAREVKAPGKDFIALAENNQCFLSTDNTVLTFQGHPEFNSDFACKLLPGTPAYMGVDASSFDELSQQLKKPHDGKLIWKRILEWVHEMEAIQY